MPRFLVLDGYDKAGRAALDAAGATPAGTLYRDMVLRYLPRAEVDIVHPADPQSSIGSLDSYDAMLWTGSSLTIFHDDPAVTAQIELAREGFRRGLAAFGSCWALQLAAVAAGGTCHKNPNGREFGLARKITLNEAGRAHPFYAGRPAPVFDGFTSHFDAVAHLPACGTVMASNAMTGIQAADIQHEGGRFFALQYHPEYDFAEIAALAKFRGGGLIDDGFMADTTALDSFIDQCANLHSEPERADLRWSLGADDDVLDVSLRQNEFIKWLGWLISSHRLKAAIVSAK